MLFFPKFIKKVFYFLLKQLVWYLTITLSQKCLPHISFVVFVLQWHQVPSQNQMLKDLNLTFFSTSFQKCALVILNLVLEVFCMFVNLKNTKNRCAMRRHSNSIPLFLFTTGDGSVKKGEFSSVEKKGAGSVTWRAGPVKTYVRSLKVFTLNFNFLRP